MSDQYRFDLRATKNDRHGYASGIAQPISVVASTRKEAMEKADAVLGELSSGGYWTFTATRIVDVRLTDGENE